MRTVLTVLRGANLPNAIRNRASSSAVHCFRVKPPLRAGPFLPMLPAGTLPTAAASLLAWLPSRAPSPSHPSLDDDRSRLVAEEDRLAFTVCALPSLLHGMYDSVETHARALRHHCYRAYMHDPAGFHICCASGSRICMPDAKTKFETTQYLWLD